MSVVAYVFSGYFGIGVFHSMIFLCCSKFEKTGTMGDGFAGIFQCLAAGAIIPLWPFVDISLGVDACRNFCKK